MSKVLKNLQLTFGETAASPKVLTITSVNTLIKAIEDPEVNTKFSGHITSESGSLTAAQAYSLAIAGLTFHGNVTPVDFTLKASKTEVVDGSEILFTTTSVPVSAIDFIINNVTINSGSIAKEDVENICSIENNKLIIAPAGVIYNWQATIEVKAVTKYTPATEKTISIVIKHKAYSSISNQASVNFDTPNTISIPLSFIPVDANVPIESIRATLENISAIYQVGVSGNNVNISCSSIDDLVNNKINIEATDIAGKLLTSSINISNKVTTTPNIVSKNSFVAKNGKGSLQCTFGFTPEKYNVDVEFVSVTSSNSLVNVSNASINGFTLNSTDITENTNTIITVKIKVDGIEKTITKTINVIYQQVFNEFKVYANSVWVVPTSNVEVKVGDVPTTYIGDGLWMVDEALVNESMDVTAGGVVLGKYGKNEYSDGSEIGNEQTSRESSHLSLPIGTIITYYDIYRRETGSDTINIKDGEKIIVSAQLSSGQAHEGSFANYKITNGRITQSHGSNSFNVTFILRYKLRTFSAIYPDLSLPSTSFIATNGTLNEEITPITPNGGNIVVTSVTSSNITINASVVNGKIKLTGTIAEASSQTSKLTIGYTINGYSKSVEVEITVTYQEVEEQYEAIDLGLPSGIRWANRNVGAKKPEDKGLYFQWGTTTGYKERNNYNFSSGNYSESDISADLSLSQDAANVIMGGNWRMPSKDEFQELYDNCTWTWTSQNGIYGYIVTSNINSHTIFFPAAGSYNGTSLSNVDSIGFYWSRSFKDSFYAYNLCFRSLQRIPQENGSRYLGYSIRAVL